jgi:UDP-N-acetylmuramate--alanine ligase
MIAYILSALGHDPLFEIGAEVRDLGTSARNGAGPLAVVEADEYDYSFLHLTPDVAVVTNIEHDHPDIFPDMAIYVRAFEDFTRHVRVGGTLILNADAPACAGMAAAICPDVSVRTVGTTETADWRLAFGDERLTLSTHHESLGHAILSVVGEHNHRNAAMAVAACAAVGVEPRRALEMVASYRGVGRRFEMIGEAAGITVIDDYAHHPTEVRATLVAARARFPARRIIAVFQPHTFSRTALYTQAFAEALSEADIALVTDIYAAREPDLGTVHARDIACGVSGGRGVYSGDLDATLERLLALTHRGDVVLTLGAGDITTIGPRLLARVANRGVKG